MAGKILRELYSRVSEVTNQNQVPTSIYKTTKCSNSIIYITRTLKLIMSSKPKSSRREYLSETILVIFKLKKSGQSHCKITHHLEISKSSVTTIPHWEARQSNDPFKPNKQLGRPPKLDSRAQQEIICHVEKFPYDNLYALSTPFKSDYIISWTTIRRYLKAAGFFQFKARKKPFLSNKHKATRLNWAKEHQDRTLDDWSYVI